MKRLRAINEIVIESVQQAEKMLTESESTGGFPPIISKIKNVSLFFINYQNQSGAKRDISFNWEKYFTLIGETINKIFIENMKEYIAYYKNQDQLNAEKIYILNNMENIMVKKIRKLPEFNFYIGVLTFPFVYKKIHDRIEDAREIKNCIINNIYDYRTTVIAPVLDNIMKIIENESGKIKQSESIHIYIMNCKVGIMNFIINNENFNGSFASENIPVETQQA